jgi:PAS domain S-box-containing protein
MNPDDVFRRYQELQAYVGWTDEAARQVAALAGLVEPHLTALVDDFYAEIDRHPGARKVITGGPAQTERLKGTLLAWLRELFAGRYGADYVARRWRVGWRHVEIGLDQVYTNAALSRLRTGLVRALHEHWPGDPMELRATVRSLNTLLDLDLAIIEDAYQAEHLARRQRGERISAFSTLVEVAPSLILLLRPDRTLHYFNRFAEDVTGYGAGEVLGKDFFPPLVPEPARAAVAADLNHALAGQAVRGVEHPVLCRDGSRKWVLWNLQQLPASAVPPAPGGGPVSGPAVLAIGQDITALKQAQESKLQAERLAAIGQMVTGLAHESGNALARSQACLEMLALEVQDRPAALEMLGRIQNAQDHLQQLYDEVRNYAAPLKLEREPCRLDAAWRQAWANLAVRRQGREATLREECAGVDLRCTADAFRLEQVFRIVLENALAACRDPVELTVRCSEASLEGRPAVLVAVRDNGPGLNAEQRRRIFEPFYTTKTKGTGLGMAIAQRIAEAHGGKIAVGQDPRPGAEILITLPREGP